MKSADPDVVFIEVAVEFRLLTAERGEDCRQICGKMREMGIASRSAAQVALEKQYLTTDQVQRVEQEMARRGVHTRLGGYELLDKIGAGGMGTVYRARQISLDRIVALKILPAELAMDQHSVARFQREGRLAAQLTHPNAVQIFDVGQDAGRHFIVMEYVAGTSAEAVLSDGPMEEERALKIIRDVAVALGCAHERNIIHRDIKPANILLGADGATKLSDLGIAKCIGEATRQTLTHTGGVIGTPQYMSPEQCLGQRDIDRRSDIYSLGITLYRMVCGCDPFAGLTPVAVMRCHMDEPLPDPASVNPAVSEATAHLVRRMTEKDPNSRFQDCTAVVAAIDAIQRGEYVSEEEAAEVGVVGSTSDAVRRTRRPAWTVPMAASAAVVAVVAAGGFLLWRQAQSGAIGGLERSRLVAYQRQIGLGEEHAKAGQWEDARLNYLDAQSITGNLANPPGTYAGLMARVAECEKQASLRRSEEASKAAHDSREVSPIRPGLPGPPPASPTLKPPDEPPATAEEFALEGPAETAPAPEAVGGGSSDIQAFRRAVQARDPQAVHEIGPERLRAIALRDIAVATQDLSLVPYITVDSLRDLALYRVAVETSDPHLAGFIANDRIQKACRDKVPAPKGVSVVRVMTVPVSGAIIVDGKEVGAGYYAAEVTPGRHVVAFGEIRHGYLSSQTVQTPASQTVSVDPGEDINVTGTYAPREEPPRPEEKTPAGKRTTCLSFDGKMGHILVKHNKSLDFTGPFTAEAWVWEESHNGKVGVLSRDNPGIGPWEMVIEDGVLKTGVAAGNWHPVPRSSYYGPLPAKEWLHLAMVYDTKTVRVFVNGKKVAEYPACDRLGVNANDLKIARSFYNGNTLNGMIREVRICAAALYATDFVPSWRYRTDRKDILLMLHCDDAEGNVAKDSSGMRNNGQVTDGRWAQTDSPGRLTPPRGR